MSKIGHLVNGQFVTVAQDFDILDAPEATETNSGLMSTTDKKKLEAAYTQKDVADQQTIRDLFKKGE